MLHKLNPNSVSIQYDDCIGKKLTVTKLCGLYVFSILNLHVYIILFVCVYKYTYIYVCMYVYAPFSLTIYIYIYIYMCECVYESTHECSSVHISLLLYLHHHVTPASRISLTVSHHPSLSSITPGRSSRLHPVSVHSCCI